MAIVTHVMVCNNNVHHWLEPWCLMKLFCDKMWFLSEKKYYIIVKFGPELFSLLVVGSVLHTFRHGLAFTQLSLHSCLLINTSHEQYTLYILYIATYLTLVYVAILVLLYVWYTLRESKVRHIWVYIRQLTVYWNGQNDAFYQMYYVFILMILHW